MENTNTKQFLEIYEAAGYEPYLDVVLDGQHGLRRMIAFRRVPALPETLVDSPPALGIRVAEQIGVQEVLR